MFTGIIQSIGLVQTSSQRKLVVVLPRARRIKLGDSIAINGACLTVVSKSPVRNQLRLSFDLSGETLEKTNLGHLRPGSPVNVEMPVRMADALDGHIVQGHVDGVGKLRSFKKTSTGATAWFDVPKAIKRNLAPKGSITVDGVSLTVAKLDKKGFAVALIPFTLKKTTLGRLKIGARVNMEADIIAKYIRQYLKNKS